MLCCMFFLFLFFFLLLSSDNTCKCEKLSVLVQKAFIYAVLPMWKTVRFRKSVTPFWKILRVKTFSFRIYVVYQPTWKTVLFGSVCQWSLHLYSVERKENSKALKKRRILAISTDFLVVCGLFIALFEKCLKMAKNKVSACAMSFCNKKTGCLPASLVNV